MASSILASVTNKPAARRLRRHPGTKIGGIPLGAILIAAIAAPILSRYDPIRIAPALRLQGPSTAHFFGTDMYGRDTLTRVLYGGRLSLAVGICSVGLALAGGGLLGTLAGVWGRWPDALVMRGSDVVLAFPALLVAVGPLACLGGGVWYDVLRIAIVSSAPMARVARGAVIMVRHEAYVEAARAVGAADTVILRRHILPNAAAPLIVESTLRLAFAILAEAALSFLGLGTQPPAPS